MFDDYILFHREARADISKPPAGFGSAFFRAKAHILQRGDENWPTYKILLQLAIEHADDSPITQAAEGWLDTGSCHWVWMRNLQRVSNAFLDPCLAVFEGHTGSVAGAIELVNKQILSWSNHDKTLRRWSAVGQPQGVLEGHTGLIYGVIELSNGHILSWSDDKTLRLWTTGGQSQGVLEGHTGSVYGAIELFNGQILSWSTDCTLRL